MNKILLIIQRDYFSRVKKKSFILMTILVPVLFIGMISLIAYIAVKQDDFGDKKKIEVVDESGRFFSKMKNDNTVAYTAANNYETAKRTFIKDGYDYLLYIPASLDNVQLLGEKKAGPTTSGKIEDALTNIVRAQRLAEAGIDSTVLAKAQKSVSVASMQVTENGSVKDANAGVAMGLGILCAFLIYLSLFIYGTQVMRGVIEEKVSRIVEVIISSVKPFQLMLGKIIGVGMVGLTQFILWIVISIGLSMAGGTAMMKTSMHNKQEQMAQMRHMGAGGAAAAQQVPAGEMTGVMQAIASIPIAYTLGCFLFYFLFGYLLYSAIFAAVGSAVDNETETQQFMLPITLPLIFTFALAQSFIINNPDSSLSIWLSMIPFTSPIAMMIRIPFGVPVWQLALSMLFMVLGFLFTTWVAARIYRVGILMYGKKASYKELAKWFMYKE